MNQQLSFEEYKQKVRECLRKLRKCSTQETERLMTEYEGGVLCGLWKIN